MKPLETLRLSELPKDILIKQGITEKQIQQLIHCSSSDEQVATQTSDGKRFKDRAAYDEWLKKRRTVYTMANQNGDLLGIIWYGTQPVPQDRGFTSDVNLREYGITFAIRIYEKARGRKLANPFMESAWKQYSRSEKFKQQHAKGIWLETNATNLNALKAYERFGYEQISYPDDHGRILMTLPLPNSQS